MDEVIHEIQPDSPVYQQLIDGTDKEPYKPAKGIVIHFNYLSFLLLYIIVTNDDVCQSNQNVVLSVPSVFSKFSIDFKPRHYLNGNLFFRSLLLYLVYI